jgi:hypothetical protein
MTQSRFVNISSYCIAEYMFEPLGSTNFSNEDFILLENETLDINQILNTDASLSSTRNVKDLTVVPIGNNKFAYLDSEKVPNYLDYDTKISQTPVNGYSLVYDRVRFHFIAGFSIDGFSGIILSVRQLQNNGKSNVFANLLLSRETISSVVSFNPKPLFLANSTYDRYVDIKIPSIKNINEDFKTALSQSNTFAAKITPTDTSYSGFIYNNPIYINLAECQTQSVLNTGSGVKYDIFEVSDSFEATVSQSNEFDLVGASVGESPGGDFLEYYLTYDSGFPEDLISILNRRNPSNDWIIIHQLSIFEQIGSSFVNTSRQVIFQEDSFDEPLVFRPVLKNAGTAVSMSVDLICRLTNRLNGEQIIREASFTLLNPKKYGKKLNVIPLSDEPQSQRVYNKIIKSNLEVSNLFIEPTFAPGFGNIPQLEATSASKKSTEYIPVFFSNNNISVSNSNGVTSSSDTQSEVVFGPGQLRFIMSPFDNTIKIKMYNIIKDIPVPLDLNLNGAKYQLVFELDSEKLSILNVNSDKLENLSTGELMFKVSKTDSQRVVSSSSKTVYITSISQDGSENLMYSGEWRSSAEQSEVDDMINGIKNEVKRREEDAKRISELEEQVKSLETQLSLARALKTSLSNIGQIKKVGQASVVNRIGIANPRSITTNSTSPGSSGT